MAQLHQSGHIEQSGHTEQVDPPASGHLIHVWVYPVKSMRGQTLSTAVIYKDGVAGDRAWSVSDTVTGQILSARRVPALAEVTARTADSAAGDSGEVFLDIPGEPPGTCGAAADAALSRHLGRDVRLIRADAGTFADVAAVHLVSTAAVAAAAAAGQACGPGAAEDPRANLIIAMPDDQPDNKDLESSWVGRDVAVGTAVLRVTRTPKHCLGVYAEVLVPGTAAPGAALLVR